MTREEFENKVKDICNAAGIKFNEPNSDDWEKIISHTYILILEWERLET